MCFRALFYAIFHSIRIIFEGSKLKTVDQKASDGRVSQGGFQFLRWLQVAATWAGALLRWNLRVVAAGPEGGAVMAFPESPPHPWSERGPLWIVVVWSLRDRCFTRRKHTRIDQFCSEVS